VRGGLPLALGLLLALAPAAAAQAEPLAVGRQARLFVRGLVAPLEGTLLTVEPREIRIRTAGGEMAVAPDVLTRSEVLGRRGNTLRGGLIGLGAGLALGVALVIESRDSCRPTATSPCGLPRDRSEEWLLAVPALGGVAVGALVGSRIRSSRWVPGFLPDWLPGTPGQLGFSWRLPLG
jgi:hypothetical protein